MLIIRLIDVVLGLDGIEALKKIIGNVASNHQRPRLIGNASGEIKLVANLPDISAARKLQHVMRIRPRRECRNAGGDSTGTVERPNSVEFGIGARGVVAKITMAARHGEPGDDII